MKVNHLCHALQAHMGVKGMVLDSNSGKGIPNALVQVKNITRISKGSRMNVDIDHDITSGREKSRWKEVMFSRTLLVSFGIGLVVFLPMLCKLMALSLFHYEWLIFQCKVGLVLHLKASSMNDITHTFSHFLLSVSQFSLHWMMDCTEIWSLKKGF